MLKIDHLTKRYGERTAVDDLSLQIRPGEICAFIGHNGAGKTTTLKACCGILPFEEGESPSAVSPSAATRSPASASSPTSPITPTSMTT